MKSIPIFISSPDFAVSGVNTAMAALVERLIVQGADARMVVTRRLVPSRWDCNPFANVPIVNLGTGLCADTWSAWKRLSRFLSQHAPCVFVPGYEWRFAWQCVRLPPKVGVVFSLQSDEEIYYRLGTAVGPYVNRLVAVSEAIAGELVARDPALEPKVKVAHNGTPIAAGAIERTAQQPDSGAPLKLIYSGRIVQYQKRVLDLPLIVAAAESRGVPVRLTVVGVGHDADESAFRRAACPWIQKGVIELKGTLPNEQVLREYGEHDVFLMPSEFEGMPMSLLEAMVAGCVPVVSAVRSGIPEVIRDGWNGYALPIGDVAGFAKRLEDLHSDREMLRRLSEAARGTVRERFTADHMTCEWAAVLEEVQDDLRHGRFSRRGRPTQSPPEQCRFSAKDYLPDSFRMALSLGARGISSLVRRGSRERFTSVGRPCP
ncbi:MAG: glycosyltransferase family 4 protein [Planctomycetota bacterium]